jgi:hypothetical protein
MRFRAESVLTGEVDGVATVAFAELPDGGGRHLVIQDGRTDDLQDRRLGLNQHSLSTEDGRTAYAAIASWSYTAEAVTLRLAPAAADDLGLPPVIIVEVPPSDVDRVADTIEAVTSLRPNG